ncbi:MAG: D-glycero-alpha-D-manno-heptose-1,7-bisphosphate 7-phosphatase [Chloroflexota bacterium]
MDRDGTLVHARHYPRRPQDLELVEGIGPEMSRLRSAGFELIMVTNQSGLARGYFGLADLQRMHDSLASRLAALQAPLDAIYFCPHHVDGIVPGLSVDCPCRKPRPGMLLDAARERDLVMDHCWFVGDILDDVEAGRRAGCRTVLVDLATEASPTEMLRRPHFVARDTPHALRIIQRVERVASPRVDLSYTPQSWNVSGAAYASH